MPVQLIPGVPDSYTVLYEYDPDKNIYFLKEQPLGFNRLPMKFRVEKTAHKERINADLIIRGHDGRWNDIILTGLKPITKGLYYGDHFLKGKKNYLIFSFSPDQVHATVIYHKSFFPAIKSVRDDINSRYMGYHTKKWPG
jgi:hypothetical protein